jgi:hypothetical protein
MDVEFLQVRRSIVEVIHITASATVSLVYHTGTLSGVKIDVLFVLLICNKGNSIDYANVGCNLAYMGLVKHSHHFS